MRGGNVFVHSLKDGHVVHAFTDFIGGDFCGVRATHTGGQFRYSVFIRIPSNRHCRLLTCSVDGEVKVRMWDKPTEDFQAFTVPSPVQTAVPHADGVHIALGGQENDLQVRCLAVVLCSP